jgi:hypothetical protein
MAPFNEVIKGREAHNFSRTFWYVVTELHSEESLIQLACMHHTYWHASVRVCLI